jgi:hypothetical protein
MHGASREITHVAAALLALAVVSTSAADATLCLRTDRGPEPLSPGDLLEVRLSMSGLGERPVAGFQAFIGFDDAELEFVDGDYTDAPFGLSLIDPIVADGGEIALAAGIDWEEGQEATSADADLAILTFRSLVFGCVRSLDLPPHEPPSTLTDDEGQPVLPLTTLDLPPTPPAGLVLDVEYGPLPVDPGDFVIVHLSMNELCDRPAAGFQAFVRFDSEALTFVSGSYTAEPFGRPILDPIGAEGGLVALAAGITDAQAPATGPAELARMTFQSVGGGCVESVGFAEHDPPSRFTDDSGGAILPLVVVDPPAVDCPADVVPDCEVNFDDLLAVLAAWGPCEGCPADIDGNGAVDFADLLQVLSTWGPCVE